MTTQEEIFDYLKEYIDKKIDSLNESIKKTFDEYGVKTVSLNINNIHTFSKVYQGAFDNDPIVRTNGEALQPGDIYFNTSVNKIKIHNGTIWQFIDLSMFADNNKGIAFLAKESQDNESISIPENVNAYSVDSYAIGNNSKLIIPNTSTYKIL